MKVVQLLPDGHRVKKEVDAALDVVSETMTPMHYHLREIIICTCRQVSPPSPVRPGMWPLRAGGGSASLGTLVGSGPHLHLLETEVTPGMETRLTPTAPRLILEHLVGCVQGSRSEGSTAAAALGPTSMWPTRTEPCPGSLWCQTSALLLLSGGPGADGAILWSWGRLIDNRQGSS